MTESFTAEPTRGPHHFDTPGEGRQVRRTVRNWASFKLPGQDWQETKPIIEAAQDSMGNFDPLRKMEKSPLQSFVGDAHDPDYQAAASCRLSYDPDISIDMRPLDALPSRMVELPNNTFKFPGVWTNATKLYQPSPGRLLGTLRLESPGHPDTFRYSLDVPDGMRVEFLPDENRARILDAEGIERLHILDPQGWDSSTVNPESPDGRMPVRVTMREASPVQVAGRVCQVVELVPNKDDLRKAVYPVSIKQNPTVQITGTSDIKDNYLYEILPTANYGSVVTLFMRPPGNEQRPLIRIAAGSVPAGTVTGFRLFVYSAWNTAGTTYAYFVNDANDWVEGTSTGAAQTGSSCWDQCKKGSQNWAGHPVLGCKVSVTDFDADASPPSLVFAGTFPGWHQFDLKPEWPPLWRDAIRAPNGIVLSLPTAGQQLRPYSSEHGTYPLYFEIDYIPEGGAAQRFFLMGSGQ